MSFLETIKTGFTGYSPEEQAELDAAREEAKATTRQLKEQARKRRLEEAKEKIRQSPYTEPAKRKALAQKLETGVKNLAKGAYQGISKFGASNAPSQPAPSSAPANPFESFGSAWMGGQSVQQPKAKPNPTAQSNPFEAFGGAWMGSSPSPRGAKRAKKAKAYDPWQNLR